MARLYNKLLLFGLHFGLVAFAAVFVEDIHHTERYRIVVLLSNLHGQRLGRILVEQTCANRCQRILIARAVINKPKVLFFDEATSALDNITQRQVVENLEKIGCTRVSIAHRLSTVMCCDRIIVLDSGKIVEDGSPEELLNRKGFFYQLSVRQQ